MTLSLLAVYHPPPSLNHRHTVNDFVTEFVNFMADKLVNFMGDLIIAGNFNIHVNDVNSSDARQFIDAMEALGFDQLVDFCTHKSGNILDLMFNMHWKQNQMWKYQVRWLYLGSLSYPVSTKFGSKFM